MKGRWLCMVDINNYMFDLPEIAAALIKQQGIHEGLWGISISFGFAATNMQTSPEEGSLLPAAIVPVTQIGIQRYESPNALTVDAAVANPPPAGAPKAAAGAKARR